MLSTTSLCEPHNGYRARETMIGVVHLAEPIERKITYETASWYTLVAVPPGNYEIVLHDAVGISWVLVRYHGTITDEHFVNRLFWATSLVEPKNIGKPRSATSQLRPSEAARSFAADPAWELAEDWSIESEERSYQDGRPYTSYGLVSPDGKRYR